MEPHPQRPGHVIVAVIDETSIASTENGVCYDEYQTVIPERDGLAGEIAADPEGWLAALRCTDADAVAADAVAEETADMETALHTVGVVTEGKYADAAVLVRAAMDEAGTMIVEDDSRLRIAPLFQPWEPAAHPVGAVRNAGGQTWECHQAHDCATHPDIVPGSTAWPTFWRPLHGKSAETARPWVKPQYGTTDIYHEGECMIWTDGRILRAVRDTNFSPDEYAADWEDVAA